MTAHLRYALYLVPPRDCPLWERACHWLGRDPETGSVSPQPEVPGLSAQRVLQLTRSPRQYGFHATLTAPFRLANGVDESELMGAIAQLADSLPALSMPALKVDRLASFIALRPTGDAAELVTLARLCVIALDRLRAPLESSERARRQAAGLTSHQNDLLARWGYPYVFDEYRFHMTLTNSLDDADAVLLLPWLQTWLGPALDAASYKADLAVFVQPDAGGDFVLRRRFPPPY